MLYIPRTRLIWMESPTAETVDALSAELEDHHHNNFMVWNVAGSGDPTYPPEAFGDGRVVSLRYPGHLCPPVMMLVEACTSIHAWLKADAANHVAVHCRAGRGRSAVVLSCVAAFLAVRGEHGGPTSPVDWLSHLAQLRGQNEQALTRLQLSTERSLAATSRGDPPAGQPQARRLSRPSGRSAGRRGRASLGRGRSREASGCDDEPTVPSHPASSAGVRDAEPGPRVGGTGPAEKVTPP